VAKVAGDKYIGVRVGRLVVKEVWHRFRKEDMKRVIYFLCDCDCGNEKLVYFEGITKQRFKSCGCYKSEVDSAKAKAMGDNNVKHGMSHDRIYKIWDDMKARCDNPNTEGFEHYGGRGITYEPRWKDFVNFYEDMKEGYEEHLTIERIDVDGNYCKENCTWITMFEQQSNKRSSPKNKLKRLKKINKAVK
jgi:hypothetical protein